MKPKTTETDRTRCLVSACLLGLPCRYDGAGKPCGAVTSLAEKGAYLVPVCPEQLGGLPTPRTPAERQTDGTVRTADGHDVTENYLRGARMALRLARLLDCRTAILKARSPSCGCGRIYDGSFSGRLTAGWGCAAELLKEAGLRVMTEEDLTFENPGREQSINGPEEDA